MTEEAQPGLQGQGGPGSVERRRDHGRDSQSLRGTSQVRTWKRVLLEGATGIFGGEHGQEKKDEALVAQLYQRIGQLKVERDFLAGG